MPESPAFLACVHQYISGTKAIKAPFGLLLDAVTDLASPVCGTVPLKLTGCGRLRQYVERTFLAFQKPCTCMGALQVT